MLNFSARASEDMPERCGRGERRINVRMNVENPQGCEKMKGGVGWGCGKRSEKEGKRAKKNQKNAAAPYTSCYNTAGGERSHVLFVYRRKRVCIRI